MSPSNTINCTNGLTVSPQACLVFSVSNTGTTNTNLLGYQINSGSPLVFLNLLSLVLVSFSHLNYFNTINGLYVSASSQCHQSWFIPYPAYKVLFNTTHTESHSSVPITSYYHCNANIHPVLQTYETRFFLNWTSSFTCLHHARNSILRFSE